MKPWNPYIEWNLPTQGFIILLRSGAHVVPGATLLPFVGNLVTPFDYHFVLQETLYQEYTQQLLPVSHIQKAFCVKLPVLSSAELLYHSHKSDSKLT